MNAVAVYNGTARVWNRTDSREIKRKVMAGTKKTSLPLGDSNARVSAQRGFKTWFSTREAGLTVESTVSVSIVCGQSEKEIQAAAEEAGRLAEKLSQEGSEEMGLHLDSFANDMGAR